MKTAFVLGLVLILSLSLVVDGRRKKKGKKITDIDLGSGKKIVEVLEKKKPKVEVLEKKVKKVIKNKISTFEKNRKNFLEKLRSVKNTEGFMKAFNIAYIKRKRVRTVSNKDSSLLQKSVTDDKSENKQEEEYDIFLASDTTTSNDGSLQKSASEDAGKPIKIKDMACKPRATIHSLEKSSEFYNFPQCVPLNQCGGCCDKLPGYICKPTEMSFITEKHWRYNIARNAMAMIDFTLAHHKACECQCKLTKHDCLPTQTLDQIGCYCACKRTDKECPTFKKWSDHKCNCECKEKPASCPERKIWDLKSCKCQCKKSNCDKGEMQDPGTCFCVKVSM